MGINRVASVQSGALIGYNGELIEVQADIKTGLPSLQIVGMGNKAIDEARQRVRSAIRNSQLNFPAQKITINLAPAEIPKDGTHLDLPIALSILAVSGQLQPHELKDTLFAGELALDGTIRPIRGSILLAELAKNNGLRRIVLPRGNVTQASLVTGCEILGATSLRELYLQIKGVKSSEPSTVDTSTPVVSRSHCEVTPLDNIVGQSTAKRALSISAAGRHNILLSGPPGSGKSLLAKSLVSLLPDLNRDESLEVTKLYGLSDSIHHSVQTRPPLRSPHHSVTLTSLVGGGSKPKPGDISLAHKGVLLLDELPEYKRGTLESLRQPLEDKQVSLSRLHGKITYPADIILAATMNPCPCGYLGSSVKQCSCSLGQIASYSKRISGPLLDRFDIRLDVPNIDNGQILNSKVLNNYQHTKVLMLVLKARAIQEKRYNRSGYYNVNATLNEIKMLFKITAEAKKILDEAATNMQLSSRSYLRIIRVARTIADMQEEDKLLPVHAAEALQFR